MLPPPMGERARKIFYSTEPANFDAALQAIHRLYVLKELPFPDRVLYVSSPVAALVRTLRSTWLPASHPVANRFKASPEQINEVTETIFREAQTICTHNYREFSTTYAKKILEGVQPTDDSLDAKLRTEIAALWKRELVEFMENFSVIEGSLVDHVLTALCYGQNDMSALVTPRHIKQLKGTPGEALFLLKAVSENLGWWFAFDNAVILCDRPRLFNHDENGRLHSTRQAAVEYRDGWGIYAYHGVVVPKRVIMEPETITVKEIREQANIEQRRVLIDQYGIQNYIEDSGGQMIHKDEFGELWLEGGVDVVRRRRTVEHALMGRLTPVVQDLGEETRFLRSQPSRGAQDEPIMMLHCFDRSSTREYWIRVPPTMLSAHEAAAWTFNLSPEEYKPKKET
jgi:hypothetical protein